MDDGSGIIMEFIIAAAYLSAGRHCKNSLQVEDFFEGISIQCYKKGYTDEFVQEILAPFKETTHRMSKVLNP